MTPESLKKIMARGEGIDVEFKESRVKLSRTAFESVCAFLNRQGGHLLLGVSDDGTAVGVEEDSVQILKNAIVSGANNPNIISPTFYLSPEVIDIAGKKVIYVFVPEGSQVHSTKGKIIDRNEDGDFDITQNQELVARIYMRKQNAYSENGILPALELSDFDQALFPRVRKLVANQRPDHPWLELDDEGLLKSAGLWKKDYCTGAEGYTLASVVLLGKETVISSILPHYKTDAVVRIENTDRYDDRDDVRCNLVDAYGRLMSFIRKHLPDRFYQEDTQRISLRDKIFREIVGNLLVHREFMSPYPAKLIIEKNRVFAENWNKPHGSGPIDPANFSPFPKNPIIAKFFKEIGWVDELGSGIRNAFKYSKIYTKGANPSFVEGDVFQMIVPVSLEPERPGLKQKNDLFRSGGGVNGGVNGGVKPGVVGQIERLIAEAADKVTSEEIPEDTRQKLTALVGQILASPGKRADWLALKMNFSLRTTQRYLSLLKNLGIVEFEGAPKTGGYVLRDGLV